jgi:hypothetical protein
VARLSKRSAVCREQNQVKATAPSELLDRLIHAVDQQQERSALGCLAEPLRGFG